MFFKKRSINKVINKCQEIDEKLKIITLCFTGHRSQKLPWRFNEYDERCKKMKITAKNHIEQAIHDGYVYFISGMALGFDLACAEIVIELKEKYPHIKLIAAIPCKNQDILWDLENKKRYKMILRKADIIRYITENYTKSCMEERNDYMLKNSSRVIALFGGHYGGTKKTLELAKRQGKEIVIIKP